MTLHHQEGNGENIINDNKTELSWKFRNVENSCPGRYFKVIHRQSLEASSKGNISSDSYINDIEKCLHSLLKIYFSNIKLYVTCL